MRFVSTRGDAPSAELSAAIERGLCADGGLFVPEALPRFDSEQLAALGSPDPDGALAPFAARVLAPFFAGDPLESELDAICASALSFPIPLRPLAQDSAVLELFWGPTAAFKDVGARFLAACMERTEAGGATPRTVLVATSGDTGGAVAAAFHRRSGFEVCILFPSGGVSSRQQHQLTCWGDNVHAFAVRGTFDDCQRVLKQALADPGWRARRRLTTANSINIGRLLPQVVYYAAASTAYAQEHGGATPDFVVPSGNIGNATAALWAKRMGFPIGRIVMATNANRTVPDYLASGRWEPRPSIRTLANAMDVGDPSNMERVQHLFGNVEALRAEVDASPVSDERIEATIRAGVERYERVFDPHTAAAVAVLEDRGVPHQVAVSTAHPAKFEGIIEPLIGREVELPRALAELLEREAHCVEIDPDLDALDRALDR